MCTRNDEKAKQSWRGHARDAAPEADARRERAKAANRDRQRRYRERCRIRRTSGAQDNHLVVVNDLGDGPLDERGVATPSSMPPSKQFHDARIRDAEKARQSPPRHSQYTILEADAHRERKREANRERQRRFRERCRFHAQGDLPVMDNDLRCSQWTWRCNPSSHADSLRHR